MIFNFRRQSPNVALLLQACNGVLVNLTGEDKNEMERAMRPFEDVATAMEISADQIMAAATGVKLARSEIRAVVDLAASSITQGTKLDRKLEALVNKVKLLRPKPGENMVTELCATPGRAWVAIHVRADDVCNITAWDGSTKQPVSEVLSDYASARDRVDELAEEFHAQRSKSQGVTGDEAWIVVPREGAPSEKTIDARSGIVAKRKGEQVLVYYEGNRMNAENLRLYAERVINSAGRLFQRYPTVARSVYSLSDFLSQFQIVGFVTDSYRLQINDMATVLAYVGMPGMKIDSGDDLPFQMNDLGQWKKGNSIVSRNDVARVNVVQTPDLMRVI